MEDLIPEEDVVVTITRDGLPSALRTGQNHRSCGARRQACVVPQLCGRRRGRTLFLPNSRTTGCCSSTTPPRLPRRAFHEIPEGGRDAKGRASPPPCWPSSRRTSRKFPRSAPTRTLTTWSRPLKRGLVKTSLSLHNFASAPAASRYQPARGRRRQARRAGSAQTIAAICTSSPFPRRPGRALHRHRRAVAPPWAAHLRCARARSSVATTSLSRMDVPREDTDLIARTGYAKRNSSLTNTRPSRETLRRARRQARRRNAGGLGGAPCRAPLTKTPPRHHRIRQRSQRLRRSTHHLQHGGRHLAPDRRRRPIIAITCTLTRRRFQKVTTW